MKRAFVFCLVCSCTSAPTPDATEPTAVAPPTVIYSCPPAPEPVACPRADTPPEVETAPEASEPEPLPRPPTFDPDTSELRGWYCYEMRRKRKDKDYLGQCFRTLDTCQRMRKTQSHLKAHITQCRPREEAACFRVIDPIESLDYVNCYATLKQCIGRWSDSMDYQPERVQRTQCEVYP